MKKILLFIALIGGVTIFQTTTAQVTVNANSVVSFSSQYGNPDWAATQALGAPNTATCNDLITAWASQFADGGTEFLELGIPTVTGATKIVVYETYNPGAIELIEVRNQTSTAWVTVYTAVAAVNPTCPNNLTINFAALGFPIDRVRITLNSNAVSGWNEIDAIAVTGASILPLDLISFSAKQVGGDVLLQWVTENEINNDKFEIESSNEGRNFSSIATVKANNTGGKNNYQILDKTIWNVEARYYRLKQIDINKKAVYSNTIKLTTKAGNNVITVFPNPVHDVINITGIQKITDVQLLDGTGKLVNQWKTTAAAISLPAKNLAAGVYTLRLVAADKTTTKKIILQ
jgi:Secretion system C-terminal sorting domain